MRLFPLLHVLKHSSAPAPQKPVSCEDAAATRARRGVRDEGGGGAVVGTFVGEEEKVGGGRAEVRRCVVRRGG